MPSRIAHGDPIKMGAPFACLPRPSGSLPHAGDSRTLFPWGDGVPEWIPDGGRGPLPAPWPVTLGEPERLRPHRDRDKRPRVVRRLVRQGLLRSITESESEGPDEGVRRAARGGAWRHAQTICRVTLRSKLDPSFRYNDFGFRVARSL